jgi:DNA-binding protein HU-beta
MNQAELIEAIAADPANDLSKSTIKRVLESAASVVQGALASGDEVTLPGLGKLSAKTRAARTGRNPSNGEAVEIPAKTVPKFTPAKALKDALA